MKKKKKKRDHQKRLHSLVDLHGEMPEALKVAELRPFLKKPDADYK